MLENLIPTDSDHSEVFLTNQSLDSRLGESCTRSMLICIPVYFATFVTSRKEGMAYDKKMVELLSKEENNFYFQSNYNVAVYSMVPFMDIVCIIVFY